MINMMISSPTQSPHHDPDMQSSSHQSLDDLQLSNDDEETPTNYRDQWPAHQSAPATTGHHMITRAKVEYSNQRLTIQS